VGLPMTFSGRTQPLNLHNIIYSIVIVAAWVAGPNSYYWHMIDQGAAQGDQSSDQS